jgi:hypothetical protein
VLDSGGYGAVFWLNFGYGSDGSFGVVFADAELQPDNSQSLYLYTKTDPANGPVGDRGPVQRGREPGADERGSVPRVAPYPGLADAVHRLAHGLVARR